MKPRSSRALLAAAVLIALANAIALLRVGWNRHDGPDSVLTLSERELLTPMSYFFPSKENSGLTFELNWLVAPPQRSEALRGTELYVPLGASRWGAAQWLDRAKLAALGFDVSTPPTDAAAHERYERTLEREVLLVLELDGPAYTAELAHARGSATQAVAVAATKPDDVIAAQLAKRLQERAQQMQRESRLFVVDAGRDRDALRTRYPDRSHYAIVRGSVRTRLQDEGDEAQLRGWVTAVHCQAINVPRQFRGSVAPSAETPANRFAARQPPRPLQMTVAFGKRLEPWVIALSAPAPRS